VLLLRVLLLLLLLLLLPPLPLLQLLHLPSQRPVALCLFVWCSCCCLLLLLLLVAVAYSFNAPPNGDIALQHLAAPLLFVGAHHCGVQPFCEE